MPGETNMDLSQFAQERSKSIKKSGEQGAPSGIAFGEAKNVIKHYAESNQRIADAKFGVEDAKSAVKRLGAGEINTKIGTWILESMQKYVDWRMEAEKNRAIKDRQKVSNKRAKAKERRARISGYQESRLTHKADAARSKASSPDSINIYNPLKLIAEANYVPVEAAKAAWNEAWAKKYNEQAKKHVAKAKEFRDIWGQRLKTMAESIRSKSESDIAKQRAKLMGSEGENNGVVDQMQAKLDRALAEAEQAKAEIARLKQAKFMQPAAALTTDAMEATGASGAKAAKANEFMASTSADYLAGKQPK